MILWRNGGCSKTPLDKNLACIVDFSVLKQSTQEPSYNVAHYNMVLDRKQFKDRPC